MVHFYPILRYITIALSLTSLSTAQVQTNATAKDNMKLQQHHYANEVTEIFWFCKNWKLLKNYNRKKLKPTVRTEKFWSNILFQYIFFTAEICCGELLDYCTG